LTPLSSLSHTQALYFLGDTRYKHSETASASSHRARQGGKKHTREEIEPISEALELDHPPYTPAAPDLFLLEDEQDFSSDCHDVEGFLRREAAQQTSVSVRVGRRG